MTKIDPMTALLVELVPPMTGESSDEWKRRVVKIVTQGLEHPIRDADGRRYCACGCGRTIPVTGRSDRTTYSASCRQRIRRAKRS